MKKQKPRHITVESKFPDGVIPTSLKVNSSTGEVEFMVEDDNVKPENSHIDWSYHRTRKEKVVRKYPIDTGEINLHPDVGLMQYDTFYAIDTNTSKESEISVTGVIKGVVEKSIGGTKKGIRFRSAPSYVVRGKTKSPESSAWRYLLENGVESNDGKTLLIVDSELSDLEDFNSRKKPISGDYFLPNNVQLMYASADVGKEHITNKVISMADRLASQLLRKILSGEVSIGR